MTSPDRRSSKVKIRGLLDFRVYFLIAIGFWVIHFGVVTSDYDKSDTFPLLVLSIGFFIIAFAIIGVKMFTKDSS